MTLPLPQLAIQLPCWSVAGVDAAARAGHHHDFDPVKNHICVASIITNYGHMADCPEPHFRLRRLGGGGYGEVGGQGAVNSREPGRTRAKATFAGGMTKAHSAGAGSAAAGAR